MNWTSSELPPRPSPERRRTILTLQTKGRRQHATDTEDSPARDEPDARCISVRVDAEGESSRGSGSSGLLPELDRRFQFLLRQLLLVPQRLQVLD